MPEIILIIIPYKDYIWMDGRNQRINRKVKKWVKKYELDDSEKTKQALCSGQWMWVTMLVEHCKGDIWVKE